MLTDSNSIPRGTRMSADVCIVGAGAAGITLALSLLERNIDVIVLESGYDRKDARTQGLYAGEVADASLHSPPDKYRLRQFGGSTLIWGGRCVPFDPVDFEIRASVPNSGWPISYSELLRYYPAANELSEAGRFEYDADQLFGPTGLPMIEGFSSPLVRTNSLERFSYPTNFAARYARRLRISRALRLLLGANCTEIELDSSADRVNCMKVATLNGNAFSVAARTFVLAAGGLETARLLLASRSSRPAGVGNEYDAVGRYYMCHIAGSVGTLSIDGDTRRVRHSYELSPEGVYCRRRFSLVADEQRRLGVSNMVARLHFARISDPDHRSGVLSGLFLVKNAISYEYGRRLDDGGNATLATYLAHLGNIVTDPFDTAVFLYRWLTKRTFAARKFPSVILSNRTNRFSLEINAEQVPLPDSRVSLVESVDELGMPRLKVDWRYSPADVDSVRRTLEVFAAEFKRCGVGRFEFQPETLEQDLMRFGAYGGHHIGTARMGDDPRTSVVDRDCRVHSVRNLYLAGSAVFPTSSQANPTLTIIALSLRLADHLGRAAFEGDSGSHS